MTPKPCHPLRTALAIALISLTGCWPVAPIVAMVGANQAGNHHNHRATVTLQGTIVTDPTIFPPSPPMIESLPPTGSGPVLTLSATEVDFGLTGTDLVVQAINTGDGDLVVTTMLATPIVGPDTDWLEVKMLGDGKTIHLAADRSKITVNGPYQAQIDVASNGGSRSFLVDVTKGGSTPTPIGPVIIDILAGDGITRIARVTTTAAEGYAWSVPDLPPGPYVIEAGVDLDSNGVIHEAGEPFGAYPSIVDGPTVLEADGLASITLDLVVDP